MPLKFVVFIFFLIFFSKNSGAQINHSTNDEAHRFNLVKVNITSLPLKNLSMQYERILSGRVSVAIGVRYMPSTSIPFKNTVANIVDGDEDVTALITKMRLSNFAATPEVRFYLGKGYGQGFYIAPYYRYVRFSTDVVPVNYTATTGVNRSVELSGDFSANTGGIMLGAQWLKGKHLTFDWWIIGAHYGSGSGNFTGVPGAPLTPGEQNAIRQTLEEIDIPLVEKTISVTANQVAAKFDGPFGGLRAGILLGFRF
jgi:hypothetical protein